MRNTEGSNFCVFTLKILCFVTLPRQIQPATRGRGIGVYSSDVMYEESVVGVEMACMRLSASRSLLATFSPSPSSPQSPTPSR